MKIEEQKKIYVIWLDGCIQASTREEAEELRDKLIAFAAFNTGLYPIFRPQGNPEPC